MNIAGIVAQKATLEAKRDTFEAKCAELEQALAQPGIEKDRELALRRNYDSVTQRISDCSKEIMGLDARLLQLDGRWVSNPYVQFAGIAGMICSAWATYYPGYCVWRHKRGFPYTERQIAIRRELFGKEFPQSVHPSAHRLPKQVFRVCLATSVAQRALEWWRKKKP